MRRIDSPKNDQVKAWKKLHTRKGREKEQQFLIEGFHLIEEAMKSSITIETLLLTDETSVPQSWQLNKLDCVEISQSVMKEISETKTPQGIAAVCQIPAKPSVQVNGGQFLLIDRVQDPGNVGTMIRTADAAGLTAVILGQGCADLYNSKVIRASQGSLFHLPVIIAELSTWIAHCKETGIPVFGTALKGASSYSAIEPQSDFALLVGNEGEGVTPSLLATCDQNMYIPIYGQAESLNVAVATGILLYYLRAN